MNLKTPIYLLLFFTINLISASPYWCARGHFNLNQKNFLQELARQVKPKYALETGFCTGRSASSLLEAVPDLELFISVDIDLDYLKPEGRIFADLIQKNFDQFKVIEGNSRTILTKEFFEECFPNGLDWVTVDGDHSYEGCYQDLEQVSPYVNSAGVVIIDDYRSGPPDGINLVQVTNAVDCFCSNHPEFTKERWNVRGKGFAILRKK